MEYEPLENKIYERYTAGEIEELKDQILLAGIAHIFYKEDVENAVKGLLSEITNPETTELIKKWFPDVFLKTIRHSCYFGKLEKLD